MKSIYSILIAATTLSLIYSCETTKAFRDQASQGKSTLPDHVMLKNGTQYNYSKIKFPKQPFIPLPKKSTSNCFEHWDTWIMFDDKKIEKDSIYGIQEKGKFFAYIDCRRVLRYRTGKINLYSYDMITGEKTDRTVYIFEKERGKFFPTAKKLTDFYNLISDNPKAAALCNQLFPGLRYSQTDKSLNNLVKIVEEYNKG